MKFRASRRLVLGATLMMASLAMNPAVADGAKKFKMRFAGGFIQNIEQAQLGPMGMTVAVENRSIALVKGRGTFGRADIMVVTASGPPSPGRPCPIGFDKIADIVENNLVLTFNDLSLLYGNGTGIVCENQDNPAVQVVEVDGTWDGGTGRFRHASGTWSIEFDFAAPVGTVTELGPVTQFFAETGVIKGHINGVRRNDRDDD